MKIGDKTYTRDQVLKYIGNPAQIGGTRRYILNDGRSKGIEAIDCDTGSGFEFTILPDRGLDISLASYKGINLVYMTSVGEVHPSYFDPYGIGWLRTFMGGLLTTCGLTYLGGPCNDCGEELGAHGRQTTNPAMRVCDLSRWEDDEYILEVTGVTEESILFGDKIRLTRSIKTKIGGKSLLVHDVAENFGYKESPFTILYHINPGFPLLSPSSKLMLSVKETRPCDEQSSKGIKKMLSFTEPVEEYPEENYHHIMASDSEGYSYTAIINPDLADGLGLYVKFTNSTLPYLNEWKNMNAGDYVVGMEPCNVPCESRDILRKSGMLQFLKPGEKREMDVEIGILDGEAEIESFLGKIESITGGAK